MCGGREEGSNGCTVSATSGQPWLWVLLTVGLWVVIFVIIWVLRTCSHRGRRHRFLAKFVQPVLMKLGVKVDWVGDEENPAARDGGSVYCTPMSDLPPSYDVVMAGVVNHACSALPLPVPPPSELLAPPSYEETEAVTSSRNTIVDETTSQNNDTSSTSDASVTSVTRL